MKQITNVKENKNAVNENAIEMDDKNNIFDEETVESLLKSEEDIENGRTRNALEVIKEFEEKYGFWKIQCRIYKTMHWGNGTYIPLIMKIKKYLYPIWFMVKEIIYKKFILGISPKISKIYLRKWKI